MMNRIRGPFITMILSLILLGCEEKILEIDDINLDLPEVRSISASTSTVIVGRSIQVSAEAKNATSFEWSAPSGSFSDPNKATTTWTAPMLDSPISYQLKCTVTNSSGSRYATVTVTIVTSLIPDGVIAYWSFDDDLNEQVNKAEPSGGEDVSITSKGIIGDGAALFEGEDFSIASALMYDVDAPMGPDDQFTISLWINTEDDGLGWLFGRTFDGEYIKGSKGVYIEEGSVIFDVSWVGEWVGEASVNDGKWHHLAIVKNDEEVIIYIDGKDAGASEIDGWSEDDGTVVTIGASWEEEGEDWPGTFQGMMDDIRFYPRGLSLDEISKIISGH